MHVNEKVVMSEEKKTLSDNYIFVGVGILTGFLFGFIVLLANLPDRRTTNSFVSSTTPDISTSSSFEFFDILPGTQDTSLENVEAYNPDDVSFRKHMTQPTSAQSLNNIYRIESKSRRKSRITEIPASAKGDAYYLQAASFTYESDAEKLRAKLLLNGLDAFVKPSHVKGKLHYRVRLGPYYDKQYLSEARASLQEKGISYMVLRVKG